MKTLVIAESNEGAAGLCAGARLFSDEVMYAACGDKHRFGGIADKVLLIEMPENTLLESAYMSVLAIIEEEGVDYVLIEPTRSLKVLAGRCAAKLKTSTLTNAMDVASDGTVKSMYYGGLAQRICKSTKPVTIVMCNYQIFGEAVASGTDLTESRDYLRPDFDVELVSTEKIVKTGPDLTKADRIVGVGRAFLEQADLKMAEDFAKKIDAGVGCTRPLTEELNWMPRETYIGISGLMLNPDVYIGIGTSGQMQHMIGVNQAKTIIAINKDKNAPLFKYADYGLVGDIYQVLPQIQEGI